MNCFVGIDLGSTTTKAVVLDEAGEVLGRGITNSRSNYDLAAEVARTEAFVSARFRLLQGIAEEVGKSIAPNLRASARQAVGEIFRRLLAEEERRFKEPDPPARSDFFRDAAGSAYARLAEDVAEKSGVTFDLLIGLYDKCIVRVENEPLELGFREHIGKALARAGGQSPVKTAVRTPRRSRSMPRGSSRASR